jgi:chitin disaccharide deacetylase
MIDYRVREAPSTPPALRTGVVLCADDFAMTNGISHSIIELAEAGCLSATSAMTTSAHWPSHATWLARVRGRIATGLHFNLTLGRPLGAMQNLAPAGTFPTIGMVTARALVGALKRDEIAAEFARQLASFEAEIGFPPDHIDGHQHVHALPIVRRAMLDVLTSRYGAGRHRPLLRNPADSLGRIAQRNRARSKAVTLAGLATGFDTVAKQAGFACNDGFAGISDFAVSGVAADFAAAAVAPGSRHLVMCHPGFVDDELKRIDPVTERRAGEHAFLARQNFKLRLWRPDRSAAGEAISWSTAWVGRA